MNSQISFVQGDQSSKIRISIPAYPDISAPDWICEYTIRENDIDGDIVQQRTVGKNDSENAFIFFITAEDSAILNVGNYFLSIEVRNMTITPSFRQEKIQRTLIVKKSGVPNV